MYLSRWVKALGLGGVWATFLLFPKIICAIDYYIPPSNPICGPSSEWNVLPLLTETKEIPAHLLPTGERDQGTSESCGPHAASDALGIYLNSRVQDLFGSASPQFQIFQPGIDIWRALHGILSEHPSYSLSSFESLDYLYDMNPVTFLLALHPRPHLINPHSGSTFGRQFNQSNVLFAPQEEEPTELIRSLVSRFGELQFNIKTWDNFLNQEDMLSVIRDHFGIGKPGTGPNQSLIFSTCYSGSSNHCEDAHGLNLYKVVEYTCQSTHDSNHLKKVTVGYFRNSWPDQPISELDLSRQDGPNVLQGMFRNGLGFAAVEHCGSPGLPCLGTPIVIHEKGLPLHHLARSGDADIIEKLTDRDSLQALDPNEANSVTGKTPLRIAIDNGHLNVLKILIKRKADVNQRQKDKTTPLSMAAQLGDEAMVKELIQAGAKVDAEIPNRGTALFIAAQNGHTATAEALINAGANINFSENEMVSPLFIAAQKGRLEMVDLLIRRGAIVDPNFEVGTPLYIASQNGHDRIVWQLIRAGADPNKSRKMDGATPLQIAIQEGHWEVVKILRTPSSKLSLYFSDTLLSGVRSAISTDWGVQNESSF